MKKRLHITMNERGFYLPYVLIISIIALTLITSTLIIYKNEQKITSTLIGQIEIETLIQMAREKFIEDMVYNDETSGQVNYAFPNGVVHIKYDLVTDEIMRVHFQAVTSEQFSIDIIHEITVSAESF